MPPKKVPKTSEPKATTSCRTRSMSRPVPAPAPAPSPPKKRKVVKHDNQKHQDGNTLNEVNLVAGAAKSNNDAESHKNIQPLKPDPETGTFNPDVPLEIALMPSNRALYQKAKEIRKRIIRHISKVFCATPVPSPSTSTAACGGRSLRNQYLSIRHIEQLIDLLKQSISTTSFVHCNLTTSNFVNRYQDLSDFTDVLYQFLGSLILTKEAEAVHLRVIDITKRLLNLLQKHDAQLLVQAISVILFLVETYTTASPLSIDLHISKLEVTSSDILINLFEIHEAGFSRIMKMLYPFWGFNKFRDIDIETKFLRSMCKAWHHSDVAFKCDVLFRFPQRVMIRASENQECLIEIIIMVLEYILKFGLNVEAANFLNQVWKDLVVGDVQRLNLLHFKLATILLDIIFGNLFMTSCQSQAKRFVIDLVEYLRKTYKNFERDIVARFDLDSVKLSFEKNPILNFESLPPFATPHDNTKDLFRKNFAKLWTFYYLDQLVKGDRGAKFQPSRSVDSDFRLTISKRRNMFHKPDQHLLLTCYLLEGIIYKECIEYNLEIINARKEAEIDSNTPNEFKFDEPIFVKMCDSSDTWNTLLNLWETSLINGYTSEWNDSQDITDEFFINALMQTLAIAKLANVVYTKLLSNLFDSSVDQMKVSNVLRNAKMTYLVFNGEMPHFVKFLNVALQRTSRPTMHEVMKLAIESTRLISDAALFDITTTYFDKLKHPLIFYFSGCFYPPKSLYPPLLSDLVPNREQWNGVAFTEAELLKECVKVLTLQIFDGYENIIGLVVAYSMTKYTSCLGIVKGLLSIIGDFASVLKFLDFQSVVEFLTTCGKNFAKTWSDDEEFEILLTKAFSRLLCFACCLKNDQFVNKFGIEACKACNHDLAPPKGVSPSDLMMFNRNMDSLKDNIGDLDVQLIQFAEPFFKSKSLKVKCILTKYLMRLKWHSISPKKPVLERYLILFSDPSHILRTKLMGAFKFYLENGDPQHQELVDYVFKHFLNYCDSIKPENYSKEILSIVGGLLNMSQTTDDYIATEIAKFIVTLSVRSKSKRLPALYARVMKSLADRQKIEPCQLMGQLRREISKVFFHQCLRRYFWAYKNYLIHTDCDCGTNHEPSFSAPGFTEDILVKMCSDVFKNLSFLGNYREKSLFMRHFAPQVLSEILPTMYQDRRRHLFLLGFTKFAGVSTREFLSAYFPNYFPLLTSNYGSPVWQNIVKSLQKYNVDVKLITKCCSQVLCNEFVTNLCINEERVFRGFESVLNWVQESDGNYDSTSRPSTFSRAHVLDFISNRLLGLYIFIQNHLNDVCLSLEMKSEVLKSFVILLGHFTEKHLHQTKVKLYVVLASLSTIDPALHDLVFLAWSKFAKCLSKLELPDKMVQILAATTLLEPEDKCNVFLDFVQTLHSLDKKSFKKAVPHLHFVGCLDSIYKSEPLPNLPKEEELFNILIKQVGDSNSYVRYHAIKRLRVFLLNKKSTFNLQELIAERKELHPQVWSLLRELISNSCRKTDRANRLAAECIGLIGGVDPCRIAAYQSFTQDHASISLNVRALSPQFLSAFLVKLSHLLQNAFNDSDFNIYAFVIQEVLRGTGMKTEDEDSIWSLLSENTKRTIEPMFSSKYNLKREHRPTYTYPIFGSIRGSKFNDWAYYFILKMISCMKPPSTNFSVKTLFELSKLIAARSPDFALFLLPHVVLYTILECSEDDLIGIIEELNLVVTRWIPNDNVYTNIGYDDNQYEIQPSWTSRKTSKGGPEVAENLRCTYAVFNVMDHIFEALSMNKINAAKKSSGYIFPPEDVLILERVAIPKITLSRAALGTNSYHKALRYYEDAITEGSESLESTLDYLLTIYVALDDIDSIAGISGSSTRNPPEYQQIITSLALGRREDAATAIQRIFRQNPHHPIGHQGLIQAYLSLDQPQLAYTMLESYLRRSEGTKQCQNVGGGSYTILKKCRLEACWRLEKWSELDVFLKGAATSCVSNTWEYNVAEALFWLKQKKFDKVINVVDNARQLVVAPLGAIENYWDSYVGRYKDIIRIHILSEIQQIVQLFELKKKENESLKMFQGETVTICEDTRGQIEALFLEWKRRLEAVRDTINVVDPILHVRKALLKITHENFKQDPHLTKIIEAETLSYLLKIAKLETREKNYVRAKTYIEEASKYSPMIFIQEAKFLTKKGDDDLALLKITKGLENIKSIEQGLRGPGHKKLLAKALLIYAQLNDKMRNVDVKDNIKNYTKACDTFPTEKNYFNLASYFDRVVEDFQGNIKKPLDTQTCIMNYYCTSLKYGCTHVYQSLPRLLSVWFDHSINLPSQKLPSPAAVANQQAQKGKKSTKPPDEIENPLYTEHIQALRHMTFYIEELIRNVPTYVLFTAFSQLVSRLCHSEEVWHTLKKLLATIVKTYPRQTLWMLTSVRKSSFVRRSKKCSEVIHSVCDSSPSLRPIIKDYTHIAEQLIGLSNKKMFDKTGSLREIMPALGTWSTSSNLGNILIPFEQFLSVTLPRDSTKMMNHIPFPEKEVYIAGMNDEVICMASLQKPKKIVLRGSNGMEYGIMCKPNDDLRKDSKVMEFNSIINVYLSRGDDSSQRNLHIRTYAVTPLNEKCGLVEWINNLQGYRPLVQNCIKETGFIIDKWAVNQIIHTLDIKDSLEVKMSQFLSLVGFHPEVLGLWFTKKYRNPQSWYKARLNYTRTAAVMSIVGYIMGLGDRHGENILFDTTNGELVHVDFNCIFNKGESFTWMERVPFRLTRNMIHGFGPLGYEGTFRKTCEITLKVIRDNMEVILSTMEPFVFDPLVEWSGATTSNDGGVNNEVAVKHLNDIRRRLVGEKRNLSKQLNVRLSVEAQVNYLIQEATDKNNLCQMFPGWGSYL